MRILTTGLLGFFVGIVLMFVPVACSKPIDNVDNTGGCRGGAFKAQGWYKALAVATEDGEELRNEVVYFPIATGAHGEVYFWGVSGAVVSDEHAEFSINVPYDSFYPYTQVSAYDGVLQEGRAEFVVTITIQNPNGEPVVRVIEWTFSDLQLVDRSSTEGRITTKDYVSLEHLVLDTMETQ